MSNSKININLVSIFKLKCISVVEFVQLFLLTRISLGHTVQSSFSLLHNGGTPKLYFRTVMETRYFLLCADYSPVIL